MKELLFVLTVVFIVSIVEDVFEYATTDRTPMTIHNIPDSNMHLLREPIHSVLPSMNLPDSNDL